MANEPGLTSEASIRRFNGSRGYGDAIERTSSNCSRTIELAERLCVTRAEALLRRREAWQLRVRSKAVRDQSAALREPFDDGRVAGTKDDAVQWFSLRGVLGDSSVWAQWANGRLQCHPDLMTQARLIVELGTVFQHADPPARVVATVTGDPAAVMLTLARACDRVTTVDFARESPL